MERRYRRYSSLRAIYLVLVAACQYRAEHDIRVWEWKPMSEKKNLRLRVALSFAPNCPRDLEGNEGGPLIYYGIRDK